MAQSQSTTDNMQFFGDIIHNSDRKLCKQNFLIEDFIKNKPIIIIGFNIIINVIRNIESRD